MAQAKTPSAQVVPTVSHSSVPCCQSLASSGGTQHDHPISPKDFPGGNARGLASLQVLKNVGCCSNGSKAKRITKTKPVSCRWGSLCCSSLLPSSQGTALERDKRSPWVMAPAQSWSLLQRAKEKAHTAFSPCITFSRAHPNRNNSWICSISGIPSGTPLPKGAMGKVKSEGACHNN